MRDSGCINKIILGAIPPGTVMGVQGKGGRGVYADNKNSRSLEWEEILHAGSITKSF